MLRVFGWFGRLDSEVRASLNIDNDDDDAVVLLIVVINNFPRTACYVPVPLR